MACREEDVAVKAPVPNGIADSMEAVGKKPVEEQQSKVSRAFQAYWKNVKDRPVFMLLPPMLTFCVLCALSILGVVLGADKLERQSKGVAASAALDWSSSFRLSAEKIFTPLVTLGIFTELNPYFPQLRDSFPVLAQKLLEPVNAEHTIIQELQMSPMGIIELIFPKNNDTDTRLGIDILQQPALRGGALNTIEQRDLVMNGPLKLVQGNFGTIARMPIFIHNSSLNETFGTNRSMPSDCWSLCYNATTRDKFWGFATAVGPMDDLRAGNDSRLELLKQKGYRWLMTRPYTSTELDNDELHRPEWTDIYGDYVFANSSTWPDQQDSVQSDIRLANAVWKVYLQPELGWRPDWERGVIAAVVVGNLMLALLVGIIMAFWAQQARLLGDVMESNVQLEDTTAKLQGEKLRLDALLVRQYNLLAVLGGSKGGGKSKGPGSSPDASLSSREGLTMDRIETMRRQLAVNSNTSAQELESIETLELLGEGTFGKVYKGSWRGTVVAVKTMLLPANMSGAEKREKMAVMEAAISSSLSHPNIVQTYTYAIRPMREPGGSGSAHDTATDDEFSGSGGRMEGTTSSIQKTMDSQCQGNVHSYEVRLVLEFCDKGCLRDALDDNAFLLPGSACGVNYLAVLDTAADVAKAMLHLHSLNVLHSDLKARNVMLATGNADGRGLVGKVGDFGLSVKMDLQETHISHVYQGTMTHMAPEILMEGRVSKAADVYAFGVTMWELFTGRRPFEGVPRAWLGHQITREQRRPAFPEATPRRYRELAERCWHQSAELRPSFHRVLDELLAMRKEDPRPTPALHITLRQHSAAPAGGGVTMPAVAVIAVGHSSNSPSDSRATSTRSTATTNQASCSPLILPKVQGQAEGDRSVYIDGSLGDSNIIVMNSMTASEEWSVPLPTSSVPPTVQKMRSLVMPPIAEGADADHQQQEEQQREEQQQQQAGEGPSRLR